MLQYIRDHYTALYLTDANGNPTQSDLLDANGVSLLTGATPTFLPPNTFAANMWSVATGVNPGEIDIHVSVLPAANGNPITAIQYRIGAGAWVNLAGVSIGSYTVTMAATATAYDISIRAVNAVGPGAASTPKSVTSGAAAATAPATFGPSQWSLATGTDPASLTLNVLSLPADGGSAITAIEYRVGNGAWDAFADANTGPRSITMPAASTTYSITIRALNAVGAGGASAAKSATSAAPALSAPSVLTLPTISGGTTVGSILTRTAGTASGNPNPTLAIAWLRNGAGIAGQTGGTLNTAGFAETDSITTDDVWTNSQGTATGSSTAWVLTAQPALTATPPTLTQGQQATISFNALPDTVTVTQAGNNLPAGRMGTTSDYTFTPTTTEAVTIGATKAGYTSYSVTLSVAPAPADIIATADQYIAFTGVDETSGSFAVTINTAPYNTGVRTASPSGLATGPVFLINPTQTGAASVGAVHTADRGALMTLGAGADLVVTHRWLRGATAITGATGLTYTIVDADKGATVKFEVTATDNRGTRVFTTAGTAIPSGLAADAPSALTTDINGASFQSGQVYTKLGGAGTIQVSQSSGIFRFAPNGSSTYRIGAANRGANQYIEADLYRNVASESIRLQVGQQVVDVNGTTYINYHELVPNQGYFIFRTVVNGVTTTHSNTLDNTSVPSQTATKFGLQLVNDTTLRAWFNGSMIMEVTLTGALILTNGGMGLGSFGTSTYQNTITNILTGTTR